MMTNHQYPVKNEIYRPPDEAFFAVSRAIFRAAVRGRFRFAVMLGRLLVKHYGIGGGA